MIDKFKLKTKIKDLENKLSSQSPVFNERDIIHLDNLKKLLNNNK